MKGLAGKNVLVTGSTSGIGQAIALRFAQEGANVAINYRRQVEEATMTDDLIHGGANSQHHGHEDHFAHDMDDMHTHHIFVQADISSEEHVVAMVQQTIRELGGLDILINNAGYQVSAASHEANTADIDGVLSVNLRGAYLCAREAIKHFLAEGKPGVILNISSVHQIIPKLKYIGYSMSKGGMQNMTMTLALEYADKGIRVNGIGPGATITPINRAWVDDPEKRAQVESHIPMRRAGNSEEMAAVAAFLASEEAAYITGQTIFVDGGLTLYPSFASPWSSE
ncbi:MAG: glucose 1-dehydrogenase [Anaerolineae bacterium]